MGTIHELRPCLQPDKGIVGLFWLFPVREQRRRIRALSASLSLETISQICRKPLAEVAAILESRS